MVFFVFPTVEEKLDRWLQAEYHEVESRIEQSPGFAHSPLRRKVLCNSRRSISGPPHHNNEH